MSIVIATSIILFLSFLVAYLLSKQETRVLKQTRQHDADIIESLLPQTQCGDCGYNGCRPYAEAIANHSAEINRCLPGGTETIKALARNLGREIKPLYKKDTKYQTKKLAYIDEELCIGCVKCINACPVDAILGAPKQMHSVINHYCTGCELCISPCPVDCISMVSSR